MAFDIEAFWPSIPITVTGCEPTTFSAFVADNAFDDEEIQRMLGEIDRSGRVLIGGGAAPEIEIVKIVQPLCPGCANRRWVPVFDYAPGFVLSSVEMEREQRLAATAPRVSCPVCCGATQDERVAA